MKIYVLALIDETDENCGSESSVWLCPTLAEAIMRFNRLYRAWKKHDKSANTSGTGRISAKEIRKRVEGEGWCHCGTVYPSDTCGHVTFEMTRQSLEEF